MDLRLFEDFLALAEQKSFSRAADARNITQPAFSRHIKALERWLGVPLIDRNSYPIKLTPAGIMFQQVAHNIIEQVRRCREDLLVHHHGDKRVVKFAMQHTLSSTFFPKWWRRIETRLDRVHADVISGNWDDAVRLLTDGKIQFFISFHHDAVPLFSNSADFSGITIGQDCLIPVSAADACGRPIVSLVHGTTKPIPFLTFPPNTFFRRLVDEIIQRHDARSSLDLCYENSLGDALREGVRQGMGLTWLPRSLVASDLESGLLVHAGEEVWELPLEVRLYRSAQDSRVLVKDVWSAALEISSEVSE